MVNPAVEREWQAAVEVAGQNGVIWAVVKLLIRKGIITPDELQEAVKTEAGIAMTWKRPTW